MAGDGWVMDIIFHALILVANALVNLWSNWSIEILLVVSFGMQFVLTIFAGFRWRGAPSALRLVTWLFYIAGDYVATTALGHLSVSSASGERQLVAFWAPFFLLHLGGPDNITASRGQRAVGVLCAGAHPVDLGGIVCRLQIHFRKLDLATFVLAAWLMLLVGVAKYVEKILALHRANLGSIRSSVKNQRRRARGGRRYTNPELRGDRGYDISAMLMFVHSLFQICKRAMVDYSNEMESGDVAGCSRTLFDFDWKDMYRVMEIELSLMYDLLYTKAAVIHTWHGYCIRVLSPLAAAAALLLVEFSDQDGHRQADVVITHILLVATLILLEMGSLLRALGSSWTVFLLYGTQRWGWFHHQVLCTSRWHRFRCVVASFGRLAKVKGHRRWSGHIGQLNLLQFSTREQPSRAAKEEVGQDLGEKKERSSKTIVIPQDVKEVVFGDILEKLTRLRNTIRGGKEKEGVEAADMLRMMAESRTKRGQRALHKWGLNDDFRWSLGEELQEATDIYLFKSDIANKAGDAWVAQRVNAIRTLSNYLMFLLVERPYMLPGLVFRRLYELTCEDLVENSRYGTQDDLKSSSSFWTTLPWKLFQPHDDPSSSRLRQRRENLARILCDQEYKFKPDDVKSYLSSGIKLAKKLLPLDESRKSDVLPAILEVWVEMLFYASYRGSRKSHARQLSRGGELPSTEKARLLLKRKAGKEARTLSMRDDTKLICLDSLIIVYLTLVSLNSCPIL